MINQSFKNWSVENKRIFLRADLNIPIENGTILNDFRLRSITPTIDCIIKKQGSIVLATHIGRPKNKEPNLSTKILVPWFLDHGYSIHLVEDISAVPSLPVKPQEIILLENLRFFSGEKDADPFFAKQLARTASYYINDAFGLIHENDCSVALLPYEFPEEKRSIGLLIEKELKELSILKNDPPRPFIGILGGGKIKNKIPLIQHLLHTVDMVFIYPALCFTFIKSQAMPVGKSLVDDALLKVCKEIINEAENLSIPLFFPKDYEVTYNIEKKDLSIVEADNFPTDAIGITVGPKSIQECIAHIKQAKTVFLNCAMGFADQPKTQEASKKIIEAMAQSSATTIIAGGDSVNIALQTKNHDKISYLSTGGGAALAYLSDKILPGLAPFAEE